MNLLGEKDWGLSKGRGKGRGGNPRQSRSWTWYKAKGRRQWRQLREIILSRLRKRPVNPEEGGGYTGRKIYSQEDRRRGAPMKKMVTLKIKQAAGEREVSGSSMLRHSQI